MLIKVLHIDSRVEYINLEVRIWVIFTAETAI